MFLDRFGVGENFGISMSRFAHCIQRQYSSVYIFLRFRARSGGFDTVLEA